MPSPVVVRHYSRFQCNLLSARGRRDQFSRRRPNEAGGGRRRPKEAEEDDISSNIATSGSCEMTTEKDLVLKGPALEPIRDCSLGEYLLEKLKSFPQDQIIQVDGDTGATQTVGEVLEMGARVAEGLKNLGLKPGDVAAMICWNGFEATAIVLGSWLGGVAVVPLVPTSKVAEIKYAFELTEPKCIFCEEEAASNAAAALDLLSVPATVIIMADSKKPEDSRPIFREILADVDVGRYVPPSIESPSTHLATILFSSGTSGLPKGVGITQASFIFQILNMSRNRFFVETPCFLQISQFFWVTAHLFLLCSLTTGMKRVLLRRPTVSNILNAIQKYKPQWSMMAPLYLLSIVNHPDFEKFDVSSIKFVVVGGSPYTPNMAVKLKQKWEGITVVQCYGTTEAAGTICIIDGESDPFSVGKLTPGLELKIVDVVTGEPLKANATGEICVRSPGIMKGYVKGEKITKEVLDEEGWLRTGDVGYYNESKDVFIVDRLKEVVKITDMQVAPTEVENVILSVPGVLEAFVTGVTHGGNVYELMALVVKEKDSAVAEEHIRAQVADTLSEYKRLTGGVHFLESFPKTPSGKLARSELRKMAQELYSTVSR